MTNQDINEAAQRVFGAHDPHTAQGLQYREFARALLAAPGAPATAARMLTDGEFESVCGRFHDPSKVRAAIAKFCKVNGISLGAPAPVAPTDKMPMDEIRAWAERHDLVGSDTDLRCIFEDARTLAPPPVAVTPESTEQQEQKHGL